MPIAKLIEEKINAELSPQYLELENESHKHRSGTGASHFRLVIVAQAFEGLRLIGRHRKINTLLADELATEVHALALHTFTPKEWSERGEKATRSPACK